MIPTAGHCQPPATAATLPPGFPGEGLQIRLPLTASQIHSRSRRRRAEGDGGAAAPRTASSLGTTAQPHHVPTAFPTESSQAQLRHHEQLRSPTNAGNPRQAVDEPASLSPTRVSGSGGLNQAPSKADPLPMQYKRLLGLSGTTETAFWRFRLSPSLPSYRVTANCRFGCESTSRICQTYLRVPHGLDVSTPALRFDTADHGLPASSGAGRAPHHLGSVCNPSARPVV